MLDLEIGIEWAVGLSLAVTRAGAMVALCAWVPRSIPSVARSSFALALGLLIAVPTRVPTENVTSDLLVNTVINLAIGGLLGWFLGLPIHLFQVAGTVIDTTSGITLGSVFDPSSGTTPGPIAMAYTLTAQTLVIAGGGLVVLTQVLWFSTQVVALDGQMGSISGISTTAIEQLSALMHRGVELALPIAAVLFVGELSFGLLSRMAPQINTFLVGLPLKTLLMVSMLGSTAVLFPRFSDYVITSGTDAALELLGR